MYITSASVTDSNMRVLRNFVILFSDLLCCFSKINVIIKPIISYVLNPLVNEQECLNVIFFMANVMICFTCGI